MLRVRHFYMKREAVFGFKMVFVYPRAGLRYAQQVLPAEPQHQQAWEATLGTQF